MKRRQQAIRLLLCSSAAVQELCHLSSFGIEVWAHANLDWIVVSAQLRVACGEGLLWGPPAAALEEQQALVGHGPPRGLPQPGPLPDALPP